ncbi:unnamed protein product [Closterium sp. NIES-64]|nr:unnamed protein product [Closterium sp. NIES-64]
MFSAHPDLHEVDTILSHRDTSLCTYFYCTGFWTADSHPYGAGALFPRAEDADVVEVHGMFTQAEVHGMFTQAEVHGMLQAKLGKAAGCWESGTSKGRIGVFFLKSKQRAKDACGEKGVGSTRVTSRIQGAVKLVEGQGAERARRSSEG